jgi:hypothetical protein
MAAIRMAARARVQARMRVWMKGNTSRMAKVAAENEARIMPMVVVNSPMVVAKIGTTNRCVSQTPDSKAFTIKMRRKAGSFNSSVIRRRSSIFRSMRSDLSTWSKAERSR